MISWTNMRVISYKIYDVKQFNYILKKVTNMHIIVTMGQASELVHITSPSEIWSKHSWGPKAGSGNPLHLMIVE